MAEKKKILYIVEAMGGGVFTYIVDLANELVNPAHGYLFCYIQRTWQILCLGCVTYDSSYGSWK